MSRVEFTLTKLQEEYSGLTELETNYSGSQNYNQARKQLNKILFNFNVFNQICPLKWDYVSKYHNKTISDLSFAVQDGNWHMKASTNKDYDPVQTLGGLAVAPPGLGLYRQAIPYGDLRWTLHLLQSDHWQWVNPILEFSDTEETD